jgi:hypothetical protein
MGGLYPSEVKDRVEELLNGSQSPKPFILDVGTGPGVW